MMFALGAAMTLLAITLPVVFMLYAEQGDDNHAKHTTTS